MAKLLKSYLWWTYERGSIHYDVLVTLILLFLFVSPFFIDYHDRPVETVALRSTEVLVKSAGQVGSSPQFVYQIRIDASGGPTPYQTEDQRRAAILRVIEPIAGPVTYERADPMYDEQKKIVAYNAWVLR
jgi:hypothetical protein